MIGAAAGWLGAAATEEVPVGLGWVAGTLLTVALLTAALATAMVLLLRVADRRRERWAQRALAVLQARDESLQLNRKHHLRGLIGGRPGVVTTTLTGRAVVVLALFLPHPGGDPTLRPSLRLPPGRRGQRVGVRFLQVWQDGAAPEAVPGLLAEALSLARGVDEASAAPWAAYASAHGLRFRPSRAGEPAVMEGERDGVAVHVQLEGVTEGQHRTVITAAVPRERGARRAAGPAPRRSVLEALGPRPLSPRQLELLDRCANATVEDNAVQMQLEGMLGEQLGSRVDEVLELARLLAPPPPGLRFGRAAPDLSLD